MKLKYTLIFINLCIAANISSFGSSPPAWGKVILDSISFQFLEKDTIYASDLKNDTLVVSDTICFVEYPSAVCLNMQGGFPAYKQICTLEQAIQSFRKFISDFVYYPVSDLENLIGGTVVLDFIVEADGTISNSNISQSFSEGSEREFKFLFSGRSKQSKWFSGKINYRKVPVLIRLQIKFEAYKT